MAGDFDLAFVHRRAPRGLPVAEVGGVDDDDRAPRLVGHAVRDVAQ
jgi:hypothetical protein